MTSQEQQLIDELLQRLAAVHSVTKDPQVDALIRQRLADQPDAQYLLVQRALMLERALDNARQQIAQLQETQRPAPRGDAGGASFLNGGLEPGFGRAPSSPGLYPTQMIPQQPPSQPQPPQGAPNWRDRLFGNSAPAIQATPVSSGPSFLGTAASAAAGVAGGMFLFNGIESLMGNHHGGGNNGNAFLGSNNLSSGQPPVVENITQNYYGSDAAQDGALDASLRQARNDWTDVSDAGGGFLDDDQVI